MFSLGFCGTPNSRNVITFSSLACLGTLFLLLGYFVQPWFESLLTPDGTGRF